MRNISDKKTMSSVDTVLIAKLHTLILFIIIPIFLLLSNTVAVPRSYSPNIHFRSSQIENNEIPHFRTLNRRQLIDCPFPNPYLEITVNTVSPLPDEIYINVTVSGVLKTSPKYWVAMVSPSHSRYIFSYYFSKICYALEN